MVAVIIAIVCAVFPLRADAATASPALAVATSPRVIITELQTAGVSASDEFIELYNVTDADIDLADNSHGGQDIWKLQFFSTATTVSGTPDWTKPTTTVLLSGIIPAHDYFVVSANGYTPGGVDPDQSYTSRLSDNGGGLQVVESNASTLLAHDRLMWQSAVAGHTLPSGVLPTPQAGSSLQRMPTDEDTYVMTDGSLTAFQDASVISPNDKWKAPVTENPAPISDTPAPTDGGPGGGTDQITTGSDEQMPAPVTNNTGLAAPVITELLPNPASPLTDGSDEFIELYNPNDKPFTLKGYGLEVGTSTLHDFTFTTDTNLAPQGYQAFYSRDTRLSLTNTGGIARLIDASGAAVTQTEPYGAADDNMAWAFDGTSWHWTTDPTPGAANNIVEPAATASVAAKTIAPKATIAKLAAAKTAKSAKTTSADTKPTTSKTKASGSTKTKKAAVPKAKKTAKTKLSSVSHTITAPIQAPIHTSILVAVVLLAVLYAAYEYRHDFRNYIYGLRRNRAVRTYARE